MLMLYATLTALLSTAGRGRHRDETGSVTLEQVILTAGLALLAIAVVAGITAAVNSRIGSIK